MSEKTKWIEEQINQLPSENGWVKIAIITPNGVKTAYQYIGYNIPVTSCIKTENKQGGDDLESPKSHDFKDHNSTKSDDYEE